MAKELCIAEVWEGSFAQRRCRKAASRVLRTKVDRRRVPLCGSHHAKALKRGQWLLVGPGSFASWFAATTLYEAPDETVKERSANG